MIKPDWYTLDMKLHERYMDDKRVPWWVFAATCYLADRSVGATRKQAWDPGLRVMWKRARLDR